MNELLRQAWRLRYDQRIEEVLGLLARIKRELALPVGDPSLSELDQAAKKHDADVVIQALLLQASVSRSQGLPEKSKTYRQSAETLAQLYPGAGDFFLSMERGLDLLLRGARPEALESFMRASQIAPDAEFAIPAQANTLIVLEHMGLPSELTQEQLRALLQNNDSTSATIVRHHLAAFDARQRFHQAKFNELFKNVSEQSGAQLRYFSGWVSQLPFHTQFDPSGQSTQAWIASGTRALFQSSYRVRTLQGSWVPDDQEPLSISEWCDRLYLWVWRWITQPESFPFERIQKLLRADLIARTELQGTVEDRQLVRNALLWLGLFDARGSAFSAPRLTVSASAQSPLLSLESNLVHWLTAQRDRQDELAKDLHLQLQSHPLWNQSELLFKVLAESLQAENGTPSHVALGGLAALKASLILTVQPPSIENAQIAINLRTSEIQIKRGRGYQTQVSQALCSGFDLLKNQGAVEVAEFARACFGIRRFDAGIHLGKVNNLLARMRQFCGESLRLRLKEGKIYAEGSWSRFHWVRASANTRILHQHGGLEMSGANTSEEELPSSSRAAIDEKSVLGKLHGKTVSRAELEEVLDKPRSTVNRIVAQWVKKGLLIKSGDARATRYSVRSAPARVKEKLK